ncbi:MAG TPA: DUF1566 domain-containing protein, partial [Polyangium sp.]|nr:DUF1566 domain-containing protein [Polyangium sp.]
MKGRTLWVTVWLGTAIVAQGCAQILGFDEPRDFGVPCTSPTDCPGFDDDCHTRICVSGTCSVEFAPKGKSCDQTNFCDGAGECKLGNSLGCSTATQCFSEFCVDGVCCNTACAGTCEACSGLTNNGVCTPMAKGTDPDGECTKGVCSGARACEYENGETCSIGENCISTFCVVGLCCPTACAQGASCETGICVCPGTTRITCDDGTNACTEGATDDDNCVCKDAATDDDNCGACGTKCDPTKHQDCLSGVCEDLTWAQWPVPVPVPSDYVVDEVKGLVFDKVTQLTWQRDVDPNVYTWDAAKAYCEDLVHAGYDDWRLPTRIELVSIVDYTKTNPAIDSAAFPNTPSEWFWTSSPWAGSGSVAWLVYFSNGNAG